MAAVLNIFRTITTNVTTNMDTVYTAPVGYNGVVLMAQVSNIGASTIQVSANIARVAGSKQLITNVKIPIEDALGLLTGRLVLQPTDGFAIQATANSAAVLTLSVLETLSEV